MSMSEPDISEEIVVFITASREDEAARIARALVESRLAACVNIVKSVRSIYRWQGNIEDDAEVLMIVKTQKNLFDRLAKKVKDLHNYDVPEIIALPIVAGSEEYLRWLKESTE
jgi:periplasmic divalent cation tolerance protein